MSDHHLALDPGTVAFVYMDTERLHRNRDAGEDLEPPINIKVTDRRGNTYTRAKVLRAGLICCRCGTETAAIIADATASRIPGSPATAWVETESGLLLREPVEWVAPP